MPTVAIIFDVEHPLILKIREFLTEGSVSVELVSWRDITYSPGKCSLDRFDLVYLDRMGEMTRGYAAQIKSLALGSRTRIINNPAAYWLTRDKAMSALAFHAAGLPAPPTYVCSSLPQLLSFIEAGGSYVFKSTMGYCAEEVTVFNASEPPHQRMLEILERDGTAILQEYIYNPERFIWRVDIVGNEIIVCNQRYSFIESDLPICNGTQGGEVKFWSPSDVPTPVKELAIQVAKTLEIEVAGIDIIPDQNGNLFVIEVNPEPDITLDRYEFPQAIATYIAKQL